MKHAARMLLIVSTYLSLVSVLVLPAQVASVQVNSISTVATEDKLGAFIIIAGDRWDHDKQTQIKYGCNVTYEILRAIGFPADRIYYLGPEVGPNQPYVNALSNITNIQWAIETWAADKVSSTRGLGMYLFDHGGIGNLCNPGTDLTDINLNAYLNALESSTGCSKSIIVYEACHSGSFINPVSKANRIILTATDIDHGSSLNPAGTWATFSEAFWGSIHDGDTVGNAFIDACYFVVDAGYGSDQFPWIDDNYDDVGHRLNNYGVLPNGGDGSDALTTKIQYGEQIFLPPFRVARLQNPFVVNRSLGHVPIWARLENSTKITRVLASLVPPGWTPPPMQNDSEGSFLLENSGTVLVPLLDPDGDGNYTGNFTFPMAYYWPSGTTRINIIANGEGNRFATESTSATVSDGGPVPEDTTDPVIAIRSPFDGSNVSGIIDIVANGDDDTALDSIEIKVDGTSVTNQSMPNYYPYPDVTYKWSTLSVRNGSHVITATARDKAGNAATATINVNVVVQSIPGYPPTWTAFWVLGAFATIAWRVLPSKKRDVHKKDP